MPTTFSKLENLTSKLMSQDLDPIKLAGISQGSDLIELNGRNETIEITLEYEEDLSGFDYGFLGYCTEK